MFNIRGIPYDRHLKRIPEPSAVDEPAFRSPAALESKLLRSAMETDEFEVSTAFADEPDPYVAVIIDALEGDDQVTVGETVQKTVWVDAGPGDDYVRLEPQRAYLTDQAELTVEEEGQRRFNQEPHSAYDLGHLVSSKQFRNLTIDSARRDEPDVDWYRFTVGRDLQFFLGDSVGIRKTDRHQPSRVVLDVFDSDVLNHRDGDSPLPLKSLSTTTDVHSPGETSGGAELLPAWHGEHRTAAIPIADPSSMAEHLRSQNGNAFRDELRLLRPFPRGYAIARDAVLEVSDEDNGSWTFTNTTPVVPVDFQVEIRDGNLTISRVGRSPWQPLTTATTRFLDERNVAEIHSFIVRSQLLSGTTGFRLSQDFDVIVENKGAAWRLNDADVSWQVKLVNGRLEFAAYDAYFARVTTADAAGKPGIPAAYDLSFHLRNTPDIAEPAGAVYDLEVLARKSAVTGLTLHDPRDEDTYALSLQRPVSSADRIRIESGTLQHGIIYVRAVTLDDVPRSGLPAWEVLGVDGAGQVVRTEVTLESDQLILVAGQDNAEQNGIYAVNEDAWMRAGELNKACRSLTITGIWMCRTQDTPLSALTRWLRIRAVTPFITFTPFRRFGCLTAVEPLCWPTTPGALITMATASFSMSGNTPVSQQITSFCSGWSIRGGPARPYSPRLFRIL